MSECVRERVCVYERELARGGKGGEKGGREGERARAHARDREMHDKERSE